MKHYLLTLSFLLSLLMVKGQNTSIGMSHLKDTTTGTGSGYFKPVDSINRPPVQGIKVPLEARVYSLERRVVYLTRKTIELQRKMDSLLLERWYNKPCDTCPTYQIQLTKCDCPLPSLSKPHAQFTPSTADTISLFYQSQGSYSGRRKPHP